MGRHGDPLEETSIADRGSIHAMVRTPRAAPSSLWIAVRFLSGAMRSPSDGRKGSSSPWAVSRVRPPLIRNDNACPGCHRCAVARALDPPRGRNE